MFGVPAVFKLVMEAKGFPVKPGSADSDGDELTAEAAHAFVLTMLAVGAGNSSSMGPWASHW